jgi:hypothetical protein
VQFIERFNLGKTVPQPAEELRRLRAEITHLRMGNDIL